MPPNQLTENSVQHLPESKRSDSALCLSGGGYRAALFHLGVCRRLNEVELLPSLDVVSSVSGGSIFAAHLARQIRATNRLCFADYEKHIAIPFRAFVQTHDIRTTPAVRRLLPWEWMNSGAQAEGLQAQYEAHLVPGVKLVDLPDQPKFCFCATDLAFGVNWVFSKDRVGDWQAGYMSAAAGGAVPLARAVAASSCFPPVFKPMPMRLTPADLLPPPGGAPPGPERDACIDVLALSDGGVYDNMGLEPVWKTAQTLIVSDGGKPFVFSKESDTPHELLRITDVMGNQAEALRKRWLIASFVRRDYGGAYLGIANAVSEYPKRPPAGYSKPFAKTVISKIRTDMDRFSATEVGVLENHGYTLADAAILSHVKDTTPFAFQPPHPALITGDPLKLAPLETDLSEKLSDSSHIHLFGH
jgi:NTE family protein